jgi:hypothetical protein
MTDPNEFLMRGGMPSARFRTIGATITGEIVSPPIMVPRRDYKTKKQMYWEDGSPQEQLLVQLATEERRDNVPNDNGLRGLYLPYGKKLFAVRDALRAAGATMLEPHGWLTLTYVADGPIEKEDEDPPKLYVAQYVPPQAVAAGAVLVNGQPPTPTPTAAPVLTPAAASVAAHPAPVPAGGPAPQGFTMPTPMPPVPAPSGVSGVVPGMIPAAAATGPQGTWTPSPAAPAAALPPAPPVMAHIPLEQLRILGYGPPSAG